MAEKNLMRIFKLNGDTYRVYGRKMWQKQFKPGRAYVTNYVGYVYPYRGEVDTLDEAVEVGIYRIDGITFTVHPRTDEERILYNKNRIIEFTPDCIFKNLDEMVVDPYVEQNIATDGDVFKPAIREQDDMALASMKYAISQKANGNGINFNAYGHKFSDPATKNNGRRALTHGNTLKPDMACRFGDVFDIILLYGYLDKEGCVNPMDPEYRTIYYLTNTGEPVDFSEYKFVPITRE